MNEVNAAGDKFEPAQKNENKRLVSFTDHAAISAAAMAWLRFQQAAEEIRQQASIIKNSDDCSIFGYEIEKALNKHKPDRIPQHVEGILNLMNTTYCEIPEGLAANPAAEKQNA